MKIRIVGALAAAAFFASIGGAQAGLVITGGAGSISATSEASSPFPLSLVGYAGGTLTAQDAGLYSFTYMGLGNPSFINTFAVSGCGSTFTGYSTAIGTSFTCSFAANTVIPFTFGANTTGTPQTVVNGQAYNSGLGYLVAMTNSTTSPGTTTGTSAFLGLSDGGSSGDNDYQDLVIQVTEVVPEPGTFALLGSGMLGLFGLAWRRRRAVRVA
ncbi:MAG: PEP-CTERM sorting domain-containing protein [Rhodospirillales bacterium]|nr:PEP-CTERM sorting domain-containing protein [Rhodospirillales bacterium]